MRLSFLVLLALLLFSCKQHHNPLLGYWKMKNVTINGTQLSFDQIGKPYISFKVNGKYYFLMNGQTEKGMFSINENSLVLKPDDNSRPKQTLNIQETDSFHLLLTSTSIKNKMSIELEKQQEPINSAH